MAGTVRAQRLRAGTICRALAAAALVVAVWTAQDAPAWAQKVIPESVQMMEPHRLHIGDRVRAWTSAEGTPIEGMIVAVGDTSVTVAAGEEAALLSLPTLDHMQVRQTRSHIRRAAAVGAAIGVVASLFIVTREILGHEVDAGERVGLTAACVAGGAVLGTGVGLAARSVRWQPVDLVTLKPHAADAGPALRVSWTFRF